MDVVAAEQSNVKWEFETPGRTALHGLSDDDPVFGRWLETTQETGKSHGRVVEVTLTTNVVLDPASSGQQLDQPPLCVRCLVSVPLASRDRREQHRWVQTRT